MALNGDFRGLVRLTNPFILKKKSSTTIPKILYLGYFQIVIENSVITICWFIISALKDIDWVTA